MNHMHRILVAGAIVVAAGAVSLIFVSTGAGTAANVTGAPLAPPMPWVDERGFVKPELLPKSAPILVDGGRIPCDINGRIVTVDLSITNALAPEGNIVSRSIDGQGGESAEVRLLTPGDVPEIRARIVRTVSQAEYADALRSKKVTAGNCPA